MTTRARSVAAASAALLLGLALSGCDWLTPKPFAEANKTSESTAEVNRRLRRACASNATYQRLKELTFDEALRLHGSDSPRLDRLATDSVVRMEEPVLKSRDEALNVTVCTGRLILELPPGTTDAFSGEQRLVAEIEYAAQAAADGSGLVYQMQGAEPIIYRLAALDLPNRGARPADAPLAAATAPQPAPEPAALPEPATPETAPPRPVRAPPAVDAPAREATPPAPAPTRRAAVGPSFNCRYARSRVERMVCASDSLSARDRQMASLYYQAVAEGGPEARSAYRRSRDRFLAFRDRCPDEACVAQAYEDRMNEIRDMRDSFSGE